MSALRRLDELLARLERVIAVALLAATVIIVVLQVFFRFVLGDALSWSEESARFLFIWAAILGFSSSVHARRLFSFDLLYGKLPYGGRRVCRALFGVAAAGFLWVLVVDGAQLVERTTSQLSAAMGLPMALPYAALPIGGVLVAIHLLAQLVAPSTASGGHEPGSGDT